LTTPPASPASLAGQAGQPVTIAGWPREPAGQPTAGLASWARLAGQLAGWTWPAANGPEMEPEMPFEMLI